MRFDSAEFLFFFLVVLSLHRVLSWKRLLLVVASYGFYASWNPPFLLLLIASTGLDYTVGRRLETATGSAKRRALLIASLAGNLGVLAYFKYINFLLDTLLDVGLTSAGTLEPFYVHTQIPLGISFYTFQTISYSIDVYRRRVDACQSVLDFALFVAFFPQLIAGPIIRAAEFIPQIKRNQNADSAQTIEGVELCLVGLFKKVVIADTFAQLVDVCFAQPQMYSGAGLLIGTFAFSAQIFCDFSGYSTIARGLALLLGYRLPENFGLPFLAGDHIDYRRNWHMTMGRWSTDYLYRPLGGDRHGLVRTLFNTLITWTAFGLWHGASWTFVLWGLFNGVLLMVYRLQRAWSLIPGNSKFFTLLGYVSMPLFIALANILFRSQDMAAAKTIMVRILTWAPGTVPVHPGWGLGLLALYLIHWGNKTLRTEGLLVRISWPLRFVFVAVMLWLLLLMAGSGEPFYYFQF